MRRPELRVLQGSSRAGVKQFSGAAQQEQVGREPLALSALLDGAFWQGILFEERLDMQATMFQPVGGMDRIHARLPRSWGLP